MNNTNNLSEKQRVMHKDLFDKIKYAVDNGFYLEAIFLEYSALEGRLEIMSGVFSLPCNKNLEPNVRKAINISQRIECLKKTYKSADELFEKTYLNNKFWNNIENWIVKRNTYVHGLLKNAVDYNSRLFQTKELAKTGFDLVSIIYKEVNRIKRKQQKERYKFISNCCKKACKFVKNKEK